MTNWDFRMLNLFRVILISRNCFKKMNNYGQPLRELG